MITILKEPTGMVLDCDLLEYEVEIDNNRNHISFTTTEFMPIDVPKYSSTNAIITFKNIFRNKKPVVFDVIPGLSQIDNIYKFNGGFYEYYNESGIGMASISELKILFSTNKLEPIPVDNVSFLGISETIFIPQDGIVCIPFLVKSSENIAITLTDQTGHLFYTQVLTNAEGYYVFEKQLTLNPNVESLHLQIVTPTTTIVKNVRVLRNKKNPPVLIRFQNQFGAIIHAYLFANIKAEEELSYKNIMNQNGRLLTNEITSLSNITINTGVLLNSEMFLITQILNSLRIDVKINDTWKSVIATQKKYTKWETNQFITANQLTFQYNNYETN